MRRLRILKALAAALGTLAAGASLATPITTWDVDIDMIFDTTTVVPGGVTIVNDKSLRWGTPATSGGQSGLDILNSPASTLIDTNGPAVANVSVRHLNQTITGTSLSSVDILSTLTITPDVPAGVGLPPAVTASAFAIDFLETPNGANPCADGGVNRVGVNINGCADIFVIDQGALTFTFEYADLDAPSTLRTYSISFFELTTGLGSLPIAACDAVTGSTDPCLGFRTAEGQNTTVQFAAVITTTTATERVFIVPEPGSLALLGLALGAFALMRRRRTA